MISKIGSYGRFKKIKTKPTIQATVNESNKKSTIGLDVTTVTEDETSTQ